MAENVRRRLGGQLAARASHQVSAVNYVEAAAVIGSHDPIASRRFDDLLGEAEVAIEPVTETQARIARTTPIATSARAADTGRS